MASKHQVIALPDARVPNSGDNPTNWYSSGAGQVNYSRPNRSHIVGSFTSSNGQTQSENVNSGASGEIYKSGGFLANVQTKTSTTFSTLHYIGPTDGINLSGLAMGQTFSTSAKALFTRNVVGFRAQVSGAPTGSGSEGDGCGKCASFRVSAVYMDQNRRLRVMEMCQKGTKIFGQTWNSQLPTNWVSMAYSLVSSDRSIVINNEYLHMGWVLNLTHKKTCGGGTKQKNCTGRMRYLTPLVTSSSSGFSTGAPLRHQVLNPYITWSEFNSLPSNKHAIHTL